MTDYERFWASLQLGKWRAEATQKIFHRKLEIVSLATIFSYLGIVLYFFILPFYIPEVANFDFLTPISMMLGFVLAISSIGIGFQSYFIQQRAKPELITYCGSIDYQDAKTLVTFLNKGRSVVIRHISLIGMRDGRDIKSSIWGIPSFDFFVPTTIFHGWRLLKEGECFGVLEEHIRKTIVEIASRLEHDETSDLYLAVLAFDEEFDIKKQRSFGETLIGGCKLGGFSELVEYAKEKKKEFPGLVSGHRRFIEVPQKNLEKSTPGKPIRATMVTEVPPSPVDMEYEIWKKLESIEKLLSKMVEKEKTKKRSRTVSSSTPTQKR